MLTMTRSVCCVSLFLKYIFTDQDLWTFVKTVSFPNIFGNLKNPSKNHPPPKKKKQKKNNNNKKQQPPPPPHTSIHCGYSVTMTLYAWWLKIILASCIFWFLLFVIVITHKLVRFSRYCFEFDCTRYKKPSYNSGFIFLEFRIPYYINVSIQ